MPVTTTVAVIAASSAASTAASVAVMNATNAQREKKDACKKDNLGV